MDSINFGSVANTGNGTRAEWRACSPGKQLRGDPENGMDELKLIDSITHRNPPNLRFSDAMHRFITLDRSARALAERKPRLAVVRFLINDDPAR